MFQLTIYFRDRLLARSTFVEDEVRIGRSADNEVFIDNLALSRYHASIERIDGIYVIKDFCSQNGTCVNNERVDGKRALNDGDRISIGKFIIVFRAEKQVVASSPSIRDEKSFAFAGKTIVLSQPTTADVRDRACPFVGYLEIRQESTPLVHTLGRDVTFLGSATDANVVVPGSAPRAAVVLRGWRGFSVVSMQPGSIARNGKAVEARSELQNGDELVIARTPMTFRVGRPEAA